MYHLNINFFFPITYPQFEQVCLTSLQSSTKKGIMLHSGKFISKAQHTR